jgi:hypothetical protein
LTSKGGDFVGREGDESRGDVEVETVEMKAGEVGWVWEDMFLEGVVAELDGKSDVVM